MNWWEEFKNQYERGSAFDLIVVKKVPPGFLFFELTDKVHGSLHVSELNWNFGLSQTDFRNIQVGSNIRVYITAFDDKFRKVYLGRKHLPIIEKPSNSTAWKELVLAQEISATIFELFRNKVIVLLDSGLFASLPLLEGRSYIVGTTVRVTPIKKIADQNLIECVLPELVASNEDQIENVIGTFLNQTTENAFLSSEFYLNSFNQLSESLYWNYFSKEEQELLKVLFDDTHNLFSKVEKGEEPIYIEFDFNYNAYNDFTRNVAPALFESDTLPTNFTDKDLLVELSKFSFWYTQFELHRAIEGTQQSIVEKTFTLFNESVSIRGEVTDEQALKIRFIKAKVKPESLREKQTSLKLNDVFYIDRPIVFSQFAPSETFNRQFLHSIDNKLTAFRIFEIAKTKSLDVLQKQGKEFTIFRNFLESQIDFEIKANDETELPLIDAKLEMDIQTDGVTFSGKPSGKHEIKIGDRISISVKLRDDKQKSIGSGTVLEMEHSKIKVKTNIGNFELVRNGVIIKKVLTTKQYDIQLAVLNKFFSNKLPLDTFYKVFHDRNGIGPPEPVTLKFENSIFEDPENPQSQAVRKAVGNRNILLIQGPPGTGKTTVITEIVKQLVRRGEKILVTSQTHIAVDNVLERIKSDSGITIARIGHQDSISDFAVEYLFEEARKNFSNKIQAIVDIKIELLVKHNQGVDISEFSKASFELPLAFDWQNIQDFVSLAQSLDTDQSNLMVETLLQWKEVVVKTPILLTDIFLKNLDVVFGTCIGIATNKIFAESETYFDTVILDEAGKANISETLTAISRAKKIILVGDHKQLPPYLDKDRVDYFKQFSKDIREQKTSDNEIKQALGSSFFEYLQRDGVLPNENKILLAEQHRMHPDIGNFISWSFYNSELVNGKLTKENVVQLPEPFDRQIIFIDTSSDRGSAESFKDGSYYNQVEADFIVNKIVGELDENKISPKSYAIVTPYSKQCEKIRELLASSTLALDSIEVATLDSFQGREHDIIIFSFTRSAFGKKVGFLDDARRLNVAFSRARKKLIMIGNAETLQSNQSHYDPYYVKLFTNLWKYAGKYGNAFRIHELDFRRLRSTFVAGEITKGKVRRIQERVGVFVSLGKRDGLIPISLFSKHPSEFLTVNQDVEVIVKWIDTEGRITLNLISSTNAISQRGEKTLCYRKFKSLYSSGRVVDAKVQKVTSITNTKKQVFVELDFSAIGIAYLFDRGGRIRTGHTVKFKIVSFNDEKSSVKGDILV